MRPKRAHGLLVLPLHLHLLRCPQSDGRGVYAPDHPPIEGVDTAPSLPFVQCGGWGLESSAQAMDSGAWNSLGPDLSVLHHHPEKPTEAAEGVQLGGKETTTKKVRDGEQNGAAGGGVEVLDEGTMQEVDRVEEHEEHGGNGQLGNPPMWRTGGMPDGHVRSAQG